jgi:hypothetical protein
MNGLVAALWAKYVLALSLGAAACRTDEGGGDLFLPGGAGGTSAGGTGGAPVTAAPLPVVQSDWLALGFADPLAISLILTGNDTGDAYSVSGRGCYDGPVDFGTCRLDSQSCTLLRGQGRGNGMELELSFEADGGYAVSSRLWVSEDGQRMAGDMAFGTFEDAHAYEPGYGWIRVSELTSIETCSPRPREPADLGPITDWQSLNPCYTLQGNIAVGALRPGEVYCVSFGRAAGDVHHLTGALGAFHNGDFSWDARAHALHFGPVAATAPHLPVELTLRLTPGLSVLDAVVVTAEGESGTLLPAARPRLDP